MNEIFSNSDEVHDDLPGSNPASSMHNAAGLLLMTMVLVAFGITMLYSASGNDFSASARFFRNQLMWVCAGGAGGFIAFAGGYRFFCRKSLLWIAGCALLLIWARLSKEVNGAHRWIHLGGYTFQPSELAKIAVALFVSDYCSDHLRTFNLWKNRYGMLPLAAVTGFTIGLILLGKDLGTSLLVATMAFLTMVAGNLKWYYWGIPLAAAPLGVIFIKLFDPMRWGRMTIYLDPERFQQQGGYQLWNSFLALGSGGLLGVGLTDSRLKASYLPEAHTDFIIAIIGEELGYVGVLAVILFYILWGFFAFRIALGARDRKGMLLGCALTLGVVLQAIINLGVVSGLFPTKGMPAPFISYGGSNMVCSLLATGLLLSVAMESCEANYSRKWWRTLKNYLKLDFSGGNGE